MLILPNMDPALHAGPSSSIPRTLIRHIMHVTTRLSLLILRIVGTATAMLLLPRTIHLGVQCLDDMYEMLSRRARSPWETQVLWGNGVMAGLAIMFVLIDLLRRISYGIILNEDDDEEREGNKLWLGREVSWEKVLMRVILPVLLVQGLCLVAWRVSQERNTYKELVTANTVHLADDANARLVWRDR